MLRHIPICRQADNTGVLGVSAEMLNCATSTLHASHYY